SFFYDKYYQLDYIPLKENGDVYAIMVVTHEITDIIKTSEQLQHTIKQLEEEKTLVEAVFNTSMSSINVLDKELRYITINKKAEEVNHFKKAEIIGKNITEVFPQI